MTRGEKEKETLQEEDRYREGLKDSAIAIAVQSTPFGYEHGSIVVRMTLPKKHRHQHFESIVY